MNRSRLYKYEKWEVVIEFCLLCVVCTGIGVEDVAVAVE
jgi:hypothetical protein